MKALLHDVCPRQQYETRLGLSVKCPIFLFDFNQIWAIPPDFHESPKNHISLKSAQWESIYYCAHGWTDGHDDSNRCRSCIKQRSVDLWHMASLSLFLQFIDKIIRYSTCILILGVLERRYGDNIFIKIGNREIFCCVVLLCLSHTPSLEKNFIRQPR